MTVREHYANVAREELETTIEKLWLRHSKRYCTLIPEYEKLLQEKRDLKIKVLNPVNKSVLDEIPEIELLRAKSLKSFHRKLKKYSAGRLSAEIIRIERMISGYAYRTVEDRICDYKYEIRHHGEKRRNSVYMDPDL